MKKFLYVVLGIVGTVILLLLIAPLFISVDRFRPKAIEVAESKLRAKVELGQLKLRLFPNFRISSDSLTITPLKSSGFNKPVVISQSIALESSLLGLLSAPSLTVTMKSPYLAMVVKNKTSNVTAILPLESAEQKAAAAAAEKSAPGATDPNAALSDLPPWVRTRVEAASFSLLIKQAHLVHEDLDTHSRAELSKVDFSLKNIGLNQNMQANFEAVLDFKGSGVLAEGPVKAEMDIVSSMNDKKELKLVMKGSKDLSNLDLKMTDLFVKKAGVPFGAAFAGSIIAGKTIDADFSSISMNFGSMAIKGSLKASDLMGGDKAQVEVALKSNALNLADFKSYVPMVADYKLSGRADFAADVKGSLTNPSLNVSLAANGVQGSSPALATPIRNLNAQILVTGTLEYPLVDIKKIQMNIGKGSDLALRGTVKGIAAPVVDLYVDSKNLDADEIMGTPNNDGKPAAKATKAEKAAAKEALKAEEAAAKLPLDESLAQMAPTIDEALKNPMLDHMVAKVQTKLARVKFMGAEYLDAALLMNLKDRNLSISKTSLRAYRGVIAFSGSMRLVPVNTEFAFSTNLSNISLGEAVKAHAPDWVGALSGSALGLFEVSGKGFTKQQLQQNLRGSIVGDVKDGKTNLAVVKVVNQVLAAIPKNLSSALSSKAQDSTKGQYIEGEFETMKLNAQIVGRKVTLKTIDTVFKSSQEKIGKFRFNADGTVTFDQDVDMVGVAYLSPQVVPVPELKGKSGQIEIPLKFGGKMYDPKVDIGYSVKRLGETAAKQVVSRETKKITDKLLPELKKKAPKSLKDLKKLFK